MGKISDVYRGPWVMTASGRQLHVLSPRAEEIDIGDIALALGRICRFSGQTRGFYSVAEHCVEASLLVPPAHALWALLHDASEAYICDVPRPIKRFLPGYYDAERRLQRVIYSAFGLAGPEPPCVKMVDNRLVVTEYAALMPPMSKGERLDIGMSEILPDYEFKCMEPEEATKVFLRRFAKLLHGQNACKRLCLICGHNQTSCSCIPPDIDPDKEQACADIQAENNKGENDDMVKK